MKPLEGALGRGKTRRPVTIPVTQPAMRANHEFEYLQMREAFRAEKLVEVVYLEHFPVSYRSRPEHAVDTDRDLAERRRGFPQNFDKRLAQRPLRVLAVDHGERDISKRLASGQVQLLPITCVTVFGGLQRRVGRDGEDQMSHL